MDYNHFKTTLLNELNKRFAKYNIKCANLPVNSNWQQEDTLYIGYNLEHTSYVSLQSLYETCIRKNTDICKLAVIICNSFIVQKNIPFEINQEQLVCHLINYAHNAEYLKTIPHIPYFDMAITFSQSVGDDSMSTHIMLNESSLQRAGITLQDIFWPALVNTLRKYPVRLMNMPEYIREYMADAYESKAEHLIDIALAERTEQEKPEHFFFLTCEGYAYGGTAILNYQALHNLAERLQQNYYIMPYNTQFFVIITQTDNMDRKELYHLVQSTAWDDDAQNLTDKIFYYDRSTQQVTEVTIEE